MASAIVAAGAVSWAGFNCCSISTQHVSGLNLGICLILLSCRFSVGLRLWDWLSAALLTLTMSWNKSDNGSEQIKRVHPSVGTVGRNSPRNVKNCHHNLFVKTSMSRVMKPASFPLRAGNYESSHCIGGAMKLHWACF